jgi:serine/threonine-protein phosphatase 2A regulatory subunit A
MIALHVTKIATIIGREPSVRQLLGIVMKLVKDKHPAVKLNVLSTLDTLHRVIGIKYMSQSLLPVLVELAEDSQWRIRVVTIKYLPFLVAEMVNPLTILIHVMILAMMI